MRPKIPILFLFAATALFGAQQSYHLSIGNPARKDKEAKVVLDAITECGTGNLLTPGETAAALAGTRLIFIGESHTSMEFHRVQLRMVEALQNAGRKVMIGLEMYPRTEQQVLDDWASGFLTEDGFIRLSHWYKNWGYNWNYYRDIFLYARDHGIRMFALNAPRDIVSAVSKKGIANLSQEERAHIAPNIDTDNDEHFELFKSFFADETGMHSRMSDAQARAMFAAQCTWDATMGYNAVQALKEFGDADSIMVVMIGSGHVAYGLGIQRQAAQWYDGAMASVIPIEVLNERDQPVEAVQASYADYIWGLPPERNSLYPDLGVSTVEAPGEGRRVISVSGGPAGRDAGFQVGDLLLSMDGTALPDSETLNRLVALKSWGDSAEVVVRRQRQGQEVQEVTLKVFFRRRPPAAQTPQPGK